MKREAVRNEMGRKGRIRGQKREETRQLQLQIL